MKEQVLLFKMFYSYVWIFANSWYQIFTIRRKKVYFLNFIFYSHAISSYFCYNPYFRRIIKGIILVHIKLLMQFRLNCCVGYVFEVNKVRCISVSTFVHQDLQVYKHILLIMITLQMISNFNQDVSSEHLSR